MAFDDYLIRLWYQNDTDAFTYQAIGGMDTDLTYPLYVRYGIDPAPGKPNVASPGQAVIYVENFGPFPWTDTRTTQVEFASDGIGATFGLEVEISTDAGASQTLLIGRVAEWNALPDKFGPQTVEIVMHDYVFEMSEYLCAGLTPQTNTTVGDALKTIAYSGADTEAMPFKPPFGVPLYSTNGETLSYVFSDVVDGSNRVITPLSKLVNSELGYFYIQPSAVALSGIIYYRTLDQWINSSRYFSGQVADHHTFDNQFLDLDISKTREYQYQNIEVTYYPVSIAGSAVVLASRASSFTVPKGQARTVKLNYRDPSNRDVSVAALSTDITTPANGTDYIFTGPASSDMTVTFTNLGSAGEYVMTNAGTADAAFTTLQVRGKPIYLYDRVTINNGDGLTAAKSLKVDLKYQEDPDFAQSVLNYLDRLYNRYPDDAIVKSITFQAGTDSDMFQTAMDAVIGDSIRIIEDANKLDAYYRIMNVEMMIRSKYDIEVTWGVWPTEYTALHMVDESAQHMTDSNGARFAFWR